MGGYQFTESGTPIMHAPAVYASVISYERYSIEKVYGKMLMFSGQDPGIDYIFGEGACSYGEREDLWELDKMTCINNRELLQSLLAIGSASVQFVDGDKKPHGPFNQMILKWCVANGLPTKVEVIDGRYGVNLDALHAQLTTLYFDFLRLCWLDGRIDIGMLRPLDTAAVVGDKSKEEQIDFLRGRAVNIGCRVMAKNYPDGSTKIVLYADDLLSVANYQLFMLAASQDSMAPKVCDCCQSVFLAERANQKYCPNCSPQKAHMRRKRKQERTADNGKEK